MPACKGSNTARWNNCEGTAQYNPTIHNGIVKYIGGGRTANIMARDSYNDGAFYNNDFQIGKKHGWGEMKNHPEGNYSGYWIMDTFGNPTLPFPTVLFTKDTLTIHNILKNIPVLLYVKKIPRAYNSDELERMRNTEQKRLAEEEKKSS